MHAIATIVDTIRDVQIAPSKKDGYALWLHSESALVSIAMPLHEAEALIDKMRAALDAHKKALAEADQTKLSFEAAPDIAMTTMSGELRTMAGDPGRVNLSRDRMTLHSSADEIDRTRDALRELLKLFTEIDSGRHARHTAVIEARAALGLPVGQNGGGSNATEGAARG